MILKKVMLNGLQFTNEDVEEILKEAGVG